MKKVYLLGIGGAGMAGLAQLLQEKGIAVSGYDRAHTATTHHLEQTGILVDYAPNPVSLEQADLCVYSAAIPKDFPLLMHAQKTMPTVSRGEMMGRLAKEFERVVAVGGTHGKTTTVGMITQIMKAWGKNPSVLIGGHLDSINGYGHFGTDPLLICEACEYAESFLHLTPTVGVLLNVDHDHLEWYGNMENLTRGFARFLHNCQTCVVNAQNPLAKQAASQHPKVLYFGTSHTLAATGLQEKKGVFSFTLCKENRPLGEIALNLPGKHHVENALAAAQVGFALGIPFATVKQGLEAFGGVQRRFQIVHKNDFVTVADDYAHHPTELAATLQTAKAMGYPWVTAIFQPFTYSRTALLAKEFANALALANKVILAPVMAGREAPMEGVSSQTIARYLPNATVCQSLSHCAATALQNPRKGELIITLGCGNVNQCAWELKNLLKNHKLYA